MSSDIRLIINTFKKHTSSAGTRPQGCDCEKRQLNHKTGEFVNDKILLHIYQRCMEES